MLRLFSVPQVSGQYLQLYSRLFGKWRFSTCFLMFPRSFPEHGGVYFYMNHQGVAH
jgi:hypothetical protein